VPVFPDRFNFQAIRSLKTIITKWIKEHRQIVDDFTKLGLNVSEGAPQFRGLVMQRYQRYAGNAKPAFQHWIDKIKQRVSAELLPSIVAEAGELSAVADDCWADPVAVEIPEFASLGPTMLAVGKPVWALTAEDMKFRGIVLYGRNDAMLDFKKRFDDLAKKVLQ
jgi:chromosome partitioning protein